jgi:hypothetical protein
LSLRGRERAILSKTRVSLVNIATGATVATGIADADGQVTLDRVPRGRYRLIVTPPGRARIVREVRVEGNQPIAVALDEK